MRFACAGCLEDMDQLSDDELFRNSSRQHGSLEANGTEEFIGM